MYKKKIKLWLSIVLLILISAVVFLVYTDLYQLMMPRPTEANAAFEQNMRTAKIPAAAVAFIRDGKIETAHGYGITDLESGRQVTADTLFTIASVSKTVTATALMTLYEQGKFGLDDDINTYLPFEVRNPNFPQSAITFRMLLTHTSSIRDSKVYEQYYTLQNEPVLPDSPVELGDYLRDYLSVDGSLYDAADNYTAREPGAEYLYSNTAFGLVGYLVE